MNKEKILRVVEKYRLRIEDLLFQSGRWSGNLKLRHAEGLCRDIRLFAEKNRIEKAIHWLGFVQGILWCEGVYTGVEMAGHLQPTKKEIREQYAGHTLEVSIPCVACDSTTGCKRWEELHQAQ